ncbi:rust resistance kinase Lr10-like [Apium graveolens]|uniref:rust resistance kinase Lr10-like n=1 Tax=Apium graveolens TaxID=4045 RepID=UPI003D799258
MVLVFALMGVIGADADEECKIFSFVLPSIGHAKYVKANWSTPNCSRCEARGMYCKLVKNSIDAGKNQSTTCFPIPKAQSTSGGGGSIKPVAGIILSAIVAVLVLSLVLYNTIRSHMQKKHDQLKIKMFLDDYKAMKPTRYTYADIKKITSQFSDKLGKGGFGTVYKGQITDDIIVAVKLLNCDPKADVNGILC